MPTASPIVRDVDESDEVEADGLGEVSDAGAASAEDVDVDSIDEEFELVVSLAAFAVVVLVMVVSAGKGGHRLPDASSTPRNPPGMKLNSCDGEQQLPLPVPLAQQ